MSATRLRSVFLGGVVNGLWPCGLVYAFLALAASGGGMVVGGVTMALFGLGTLPALALVGVGGQAVSIAARRKMVTAAALCVVLTDVVAVGRGVLFLLPVATSADNGCPMCR